MSANEQVIFLCGARDFHAMDWYRSALKLRIWPKPIILTDIIDAEGFKILIDQNDSVHKLIIIDDLLFKNQTTWGHIWRNVVKAVLFPFQVLLVKSHAKNYNKPIYYAHSMYYVWLAWAAGVQFVGTPQGSDILIKPQKSTVFRFLSRCAMRSALFITVDSTKMVVGVENIAGFRPVLIQNGIDIGALEGNKIRAKSKPLGSQKIVSFRGFTELYRIHEIVDSRNRSNTHASHTIDFVYPFHDQAYVDQVKADLHSGDKLFGRVERGDLYNLFRSAMLCISIPSSDSSPRSVYEAIFCGSIVAISMESYYYDLPESMQQRIIVIDFSDPNWFGSTMEKAFDLRKKCFSPCEKATYMFDQVKSFRELHNKAVSMLGR